jgi:hypothetical protein
MSIEIITDGIIDLIKKNIIAKTDVTSDVSIGDTTVSVYNSYRFHAGEEIVLIDYGYNQPGHVHYNSFEYARIKNVNNTNSITLYSPVNSNWEISQKTVIQKTIGHSPLYEDNVLYGDREVIPIDDIAITVEPLSLGNEWMYIQGGLNEEYKLRIMIYGKSILSDEGRRILDRYSYAVYSLLMRNLHMDINDYDTKLITDVVEGGSVVIIENNEKNRNIFLVSTASGDPCHPYIYKVQDNLGITSRIQITNRLINGATIELTLSEPLPKDFNVAEFAALIRCGIYIWDSRVDSINYGQVSKGSAFLRASEISWFGKSINEHVFPQTSDGLDNF